jgi:predicted nucleic acid-binding protein
VIRAGEYVFVDTGAWIALAASRDPLHDRARQAWKTVNDAGCHLIVSIPVILETFTFLDRNIRREVALRWQASLGKLERFEIVPCDHKDLERSWPYMGRKDLHKLSAVDATSFAIMKQRGIRAALSFDHHFASVGFRIIG